MFPKFISLFEIFISFSLKNPWWLQTSKSMHCFTRLFLNCYELLECDILIMTFLYGTLSWQETRKCSGWSWRYRIYLLARDSKGQGQKETSVSPSVILLTSWRPCNNLLPQSVLRNNTSVRGSLPKFGDKIS